MGAEKLRKELRSGVYALITLKLLRDEGPMHGYALRLRIRELFDGVLDPSEGTIYEMLKTMAKHRLIESYWSIHGGRPRKIYKITDKGKDVLKGMERDIDAIRRAMIFLLGGDEW